MDENSEKIARLASIDKDRVESGEYDDWTLRRPTADSYTNEWYRKQFSALSHYFQNCLSEIIEMAAQFRRLRKEVDDIARPRREDAARIGELQSRIEALEQQRASDMERMESLVARIDKASEVVAELRRRMN